MSKKVASFTSCCGILLFFCGMLTASGEKNALHVQAQIVEANNVDVNFSGYHNFAGGYFNDCNYILRFRPRAEEAEITAELKVWRRVCKPTSSTIPIVYYPSALEHKAAQIYSEDDSPLSTVFMTAGLAVIFLSCLVFYTPKKNSATV